MLDSRHDFIQTGNNKMVEGNYNCKIFQIQDKTFYKCSEYFYDYITLGMKRKDSKDC